MCAGAIVHCRLARLSLEYPIPRVAQLEAMNLLQFPTLNHATEITSGVMSGLPQPVAEVLQENANPLTAPDSEP